MVDGEKFRVLIVDDVAETRENVRKLLQFESDIDVVAAARTGREAIQLSQETNPDVVLMDINMPDMDGIAATEAIRQKMPAVQVVILSVQGDQNYMRRAMLVGARDFLTKPPMPDELVAAIRRAGKMAREERAKSTQVFVAAQGSPNRSTTTNLTTRGKIILVYSPKGGTGCTTIAVNLAVALHNEETRVVIVDANLQFGDVAIFLNEQGKNTVIDLAPRVDELDPEIVDSVMIKNAASGVHVLASPSRPENAEKINADQFAKLLRYLRQLYAYVVVDSSAYLTDVTLSVLDIADAIVLIATQDIPSIKNDRLFLDLLLTLNVPADKIAFVMNKFDKRIAISPEKVGENLRQEVMAVIPLDERTVIPASNRGVPFMLDNKTQPASKGIYTLVEALRAKLVKREMEESEAMAKR
ncbi:MAG: response regulator [Anaerolineales bacterium]|jgi:pilus assembly protein CpaE